VITTNDGPAVHIWDLSALRRHLVQMGLDWDAPPLPEASNSSESAEDTRPLVVNVDFGRLKQRAELYDSHFEQYTVPPEDLVARCTERLRLKPYHPESLHERGHALFRLERFEEALADFSAALELCPLDAHLRAYRGVCLFHLKRYAGALGELEAAFRSD